MLSTPSFFRLPAAGINPALGSATLAVGHNRRAGWTDSGVPRTGQRSRDLRNSNQRNNKFSGAEVSAVLSPGYGSESVVFNGRVGRRDPVDFFKVTLLPDARISRLFASRQTIRQAPLNFQMIGDIRDNKITLIGTNLPVSDFPPSSYPIRPALVNRTGEPVDLYFRFAAIGRRESRYNLAFSFFQ
jgi:hypothetical protein